MARRIILGRDGSTFRFRVSQPGFDATTADLDNLVFDADNIPTRIAATGLATVNKAPSPHDPTVLALAHGASPSLCIGVALPLDVVNPGSYEGMWWYSEQNPDIGDGSPGGNVFNLEALRNQWVTPWLYSGDDSAGDTQSCGWGIRWNSSTISLVNYSYNPIRVRWAALEF